MLDHSPGIIFPLFILILAFSGCNILDDEQEVTAQLGSSFVLQEGERAYFEEEKLFLTFLDVREDSRCPLEVECLWEGQISIEVELLPEGQSAETGLLEGFLGAGGQDSLSKRFTSYQLQIDLLTPYPEADQPVAETKTGTFKLHQTAIID